MSDVICWPCRHNDHENCAGETKICFCPKCWDNDERACSDGYDQAVELKAIVEAA